MPSRRLSLPQISKSIGNQKPPILLEVEVIAWKALFAVARGEIDAEVAFAQVMDTIPWQKLVTVSSSERYWFKPGMHHLSISFRILLPKSHSHFNASQACEPAYF